MVLRGTQEFDTQLLLDVYVLLGDPDAVTLCYEPYRVIYGIPSGLPVDFDHWAIWLDDDRADAVPLALSQGSWPCFGEVLATIEAAAPVARAWLDPLTDIEVALTRARIAMDMLPTHAVTAIDHDNIVITLDYGAYSVACCDIPALADAIDRLMATVVATQPGFWFLVGRVLTAYRVPTTDDVDPADDDDLCGRRRHDGAGEE